MVEINERNAISAAQAVKAGELPGPAKTLAEALARIYADGGRYVQKTGQMQGVARYSFAKEGDFIAAVRPLMETHGVTVRPVKMEVLLNETFQRKSGGDAYRVVILVTYEFLHASGDKATAQAIGEGIDSGDKAFNKAMTGAFKYALRETFCTETGDDPDDTPSHEQERKPVAQTKPAPQTNGVTDYARQIVAKLDAAKSRADGGPVWNQYDADAKANRVSAADRAAIDAAFKLFGQRFPAATAKA